MVTKAPPIEATAEERQGATPEAVAAYPLRIQLPHEWQLSDEALLEIGTLNDEWCFEADDEGGLFLMPPPAPKSARRELRIAAQLMHWSDSHNGEAFPSATFRLPNGWRRAPDAAWISDERLANIEPDHEGIWAVCPDFVVEVRSKTERLRLQHEKMEMWIEQGAREAWLVDPHEQMLTIYRTGQDLEQLERPESVTAVEIADDLTIDLTRVWPPRDQVPASS